MDGRPVICAFEESPPARRAVEAAAWIADALRTPLQVVHVFDAGAQPAVPRHEDLADPLLREELRARIDERTRARLRSVLRSVVGSSGRWRHACPALASRFRRQRRLP